MKGENVMRYRGWLLPPALRDFHEGRIWLKIIHHFQQKILIKRYSENTSV